MALDQGPCHLQGGDFLSSNVKNFLIHAATFTCDVLLRGVFMYLGVFLLLTVIGYNLEWWTIWNAIWTVVGIELIKTATDTMVSIITIKD